LGRKVLGEKSTFLEFPEKYMKRKNLGRKNLGKKELWGNELWENELRGIDLGNN
jgi:hypothetical protein